MTIWVVLVHLMECETLRNQSIERRCVCGIVEDYRTFIEDFKRVLEFVEWLEEEF